MNWLHLWNLSVCLINMENVVLFRPFGLLSLKSAIHWSFAKMRQISKNVILANGETNKNEKPLKTAGNKTAIDFFHSS